MPATVRPCFEYLFCLLLVLANNDAIPGTIIPFRVIRVKFEEDVMETQKGNLGGYKIDFLVSWRIISSGLIQDFGLRYFGATCRALIQLNKNIPTRSALISRLSKLRLGRKAWLNSSAKEKNKTMLAPKDKLWLVILILLKLTATFESNVSMP